MEVCWPHQNLILRVSSRSREYCFARDSVRPSSHGASSLPQALRAVAAILGEAQASRRLGGRGRHALGCPRRCLPVARAQRHTGGSPDEAEVVRLRPAAQDLLLGGATAPKPCVEKLRARQYEFTTKSPVAGSCYLLLWPRHSGSDLARNHMYYKTKRAGAGVFWLDPTASVRRVAVTLAGEILPLREVRIRRQVGVRCASVLVCMTLCEVPSSAHRQSGRFLLGAATLMPASASRRASPCDVCDFCKPHW